MPERPSAQIIRISLTPRFLRQNRTENQYFAFSTLVNRKTREILGQDPQICYDGVYRAIKNKSQTFTVESFNADLSDFMCFLSINFLLLNFVLNIILLFLRFYPVFSRQLYWGTLILSFLLTYFQQNI